MYTNHVTYWLKKSGDKVKKQIKNVCFAGMKVDKTSKAEKFYFLCEVDKSLTRDDIVFYLDFLKNILLEKSWNCRFLKTGKGEEQRILFVTNISAISNNNVLGLLYGTLFRMLQEFPEVVKEFSEKKSKSKKKSARLEENFVIFQDSHKIHGDGITKIKYDGMAGHGPVYRYGGRGSNIKLETFKERLKNKNCISVQSHFN